MDPITASILANVGGQVVGGVANRALNPQKPYDFVRPVLGQAQATLAATEESQKRANDQLTGDLAAAGVTGYGGVAARESLMRTAALQEQQLRGQIADAIATAENQTNNLNTQVNNTNAANRAQAISSGIAAATSIYGDSLLDKTPQPDTQSSPAATSYDLADAYSASGGNPQIDMYRTLMPVITPPVERPRENRQRDGEMNVMPTPQLRLPYGNTIFSGNGFYEPDFSNSSLFKAFNF